MVIYSRPAAQAQGRFEGAVAVRERKLPAGRLRFISDAEQLSATVLCGHVPTEPSCAIDYSSNEIIKLSQ